MATDTRKIKYSIESSREGTPTLSIINDQGKKIYIHSRYYPLKESESITNKFRPEKFDVVIILGAGLAYHLLPLKDIKDKYTKIIIIDAIKEIFSEIAKNPDTEFLVKSDNIKLIAGMNFDQIEDSLNKEIDFKEIKGFDVIDHPPSVRALSGYYGNIKKILQRIVNKKAGNTATKNAFGMLYLRNILKNINNLESLYPVSAFFDKMAEYPAMVIASGPSLENYLREIKEAQNKFFIIAVDSALNTLFINNIVPDFFLSIDPQPFIYEHVFEADTGRTVPVFTVSSHPLMIERFKSACSLLSLNTHPVSQVIDDISGYRIGNIDSGTGTVAGDAIMAAKKFGFDAAGLAGFDFSFHNFIIYPRGTAYQKRFAYSLSRINPIETTNFNYIMKSSRGIKIENKFTRKSFIQYKESIERFVNKTAINNIFNINNNGINLEKIRSLDIKLFINTYCGNNLDKESIINKIFASSKNTGDLFPNEKLNAFIKGKDIFEEIINESFEKKPALTKIEKLKLIF